MGEMAALGYLYDATSDSFDGTNAMRKRIPPSAIKSQDSNSMDITYISSDKLSEKCSHFEVSPELRLSVMCGLVKLSGSGSYLSDQKTVDKNASMSLCCRLTTKDERINVNFDEIEECFSLSTIKNSQATHVVTGISWGANVVIRAEFQLSESESERNKALELSGEFEKIMKKFSANLNLDVSDKEKGMFQRTEIRCFGDVLPKNGELPTTIESAINFAKSVPELVKECNEGRGMPLTFTLTPLDNLRRILNLKLKIEKQLISLEFEILASIIKIFEDLTTSRQRLEGFSRMVDNHSNNVHQKWIDEINEKRQNLSLHEGNLRTELARLLPCVRSGQVKVDTLQELINGHQTSDITLPKIEQAINGWSQVREKIKFIESMTKIGALFLARGDNFDSILTDQSFDHTVYALFIKIDQVQGNTWDLHRQVFLDQCKSQEKCKCFIVDCEIHPKLWPGEMRLKKYQMGCEVCSDLAAEMDAFSKLNLVKSTEEKEKLLRLPNKRVLLELKCGGRYCRPTDASKWHCFECKDEIYYGFDDKFYCKCGWVDAVSCTFKCNEREHGIDFKSMDRDFLQQQLSLLRPLKERNLLILGLFVFFYFCKFRFSFAFLFVLKFA